MIHRRLLLGVAVPCLMLAALCGGWSEAADQGFRLTRVYGDSSTLTVTALPLQAEVRVDGLPVGSAHDLVARALALVPGDHVVEIWAPGYVPALVNVTGIANWASHIHLELVPERGR